MIYFAKVSVSVQQYYYCIRSSETDLWKSSGLLLGVYATRRLGCYATCSVMSLGVLFTNVARSLRVKVIPSLTKSFRLGFTDHMIYSSVIPCPIYKNQLLSMWVMKPQRTPSKKAMIANATSVSM